MNTTPDLTYKPDDMEAEKASNSYLMSLIAIMAGLPFPIINLIATFIFFAGNRKGTPFVRWHCTQALLSQFSLVLINSVAFYWTISIITGNKTISNLYIAYLITIIIFNISEFIATIYTAINTRKGQHIQWYFYGPLTNLICKP
jgi:uncharacterized Tic20 family protein